MGFSQNSVFLINFHHLLKTSKRKNTDYRLRRTFPWVLWHLWKAKTTLLFEKAQTSPLDILSKARKDANLWIQVNYQETPSINHAAVTPSTNPAVVRPSTHTSVWHKPRQGDLKCNVASFWILYNHHGETLLNSRRTCTKLGYEVHVALLNLHWAIKSMMHLHFHRIIIEFSLTALRDVLSSPEFYPQYHKSTTSLMIFSTCLSVLIISAFATCLLQKTKFLKVLHGRWYW